MRTNETGSFFRLACAALKYFLLAVFGFALVCIVSSLLGGLHIATLLISVLGIWILRLAVVVLGIVAIAVVGESLRQ